MAKLVIRKHPDIASEILVSLPEHPSGDLSLISGYFKLYCNIIETDPMHIQGAVYKSSITEKKKIFISAMMVLYNEQYRLKSILSETLKQQRSTTTAMITEVKFRYQKDTSFHEIVDEILKKLTTHKS